MNMIFSFFVQEIQSKESMTTNVLTDWCLVELPNSENELLKRTKDPDQV